MFYVYLLNSSTKKARSKYETNKKKTSYDFSVSLCFMYLVPIFSTELSNLYLAIEIRLSIRHRTIKKIVLIKTRIDLAVLIEIYRGYTLSSFVIMILSSMLKVPSVYKNIIYVAYDITYTDFAMRSVIERNHDQTHNWL